MEIPKRIPLNFAQNQLLWLEISCFQPMSASGNATVLRDDLSERHDKIVRFKKWADTVVRQTGCYPEEEVLEFVAFIKTSSAH